MTGKSGFYPYASIVQDAAQRHPDTLDSINSNKDCDAYQLDIHAQESFLK